MNNIEHSACFTGHRPSKFPFDTSDPLYLGMFLSTVYLIAYEAVLEGGIDTFYCGMQVGMDVWAGKQVLKLRESFPQVRLICVSPYRSEISRRFGRDLEDYILLRDSCDEFVALREDYFPSCFAERNRYMVDRSSYVIGAAVPDCPSGTMNTINYAKRLGRKLRIIDLRQFALDYGLD